MHIVFVFHIGTVPENLNHVIDNSALRIDLGIKLRPDYLSEKNRLRIKKNQKKKGKIRFKCLHCDYLTLKKQNLVGHLRKKHEVLWFNFTNCLLLITLY